MIIIYKISRVEVVHTILGSIYIDCFLFSAQDNFGIVEPFPENLYPIEFTSAQVTCVAFDSTGVKTPDKIQFMRKNNFAIYTKLTENENLYFTRRQAVDVGQGKYLSLKNETLF